MTAGALLELDGGHLYLGGADGGSLKHRLMDDLVRAAVEQGGLRPGDRVADLSPGCGALALAHAARARGLRARVHVPDNLPPELQRALVQADAEVVTDEPTPEGLRRTLDTLQAEHDAGLAWWTRQNFTPRARTAYRGLAQDLRDQGLQPGSLVAGVGSGSTLWSFGDVFGGARLHAVYSPDIRGLRPVQAEMDRGRLRDNGAWTRLARRFGTFIQPWTVAMADVADSAEALRGRGVRAGLSTAAVWHVMQQIGSEGALGISMDGCRL